MFCLGLGTTGSARVNLLSFKSIHAAFDNPTFEYSIPNGENRMLIVTIVNEYSNSVDYNITSISYGGVLMLKVGESGSSSLISRNEIETYYLLDSSITKAADSTIIVTYDKSSTSSLDEASYTAISFENVEQNFPIFSFSKNALTSVSMITTDQITTDPQDGIISILNSSNQDATFNSCSSFTCVEQTTGSALSKSLSWSEFRINDCFTPKYSSSNVAGRVSMMTFGVKASLGAPLPVKLTHFEANIESGRFAILNWITQSEQNSNYFIVEKSLDFRNWEAIETIAAAGNSNISKSYSANDYNMTAGTTYYRLTQVDFNGELKTFEPVSVDLKIETSPSFYPNPAQETLYVSGLNCNNQQIEIANINGETNSAHMVGNAIDISEFANGLYLLTINNQTHKFVVAH